MVCWAPRFSPRWCVNRLVFLFPRYLKAFLFFFFQVIWTKNNPTPWNSVGQNDNIKLMSGSHKFEKRFVQGHVQSFNAALTFSQLDSRQTLEIYLSLGIHLYIIPESSFLLHDTSDRRSAGALRINNYIPSHLIHVEWYC